MNPRKPRRRPPPPPKRERSLSPAAARACTWLSWGAVALYGAAVLAMIAGPHKIGDVFAETDFYGGYVAGARALLLGHLDPARYGVVGPGYEVALALIGALVPNLFLAAELLSALAMVAALVLWNRLLVRRADPRLALVATLFLVTNATFFRYGYSVTNDALAFALLSASLATLLVGSATRSAAIAGVCGALAFLTRYNAVALLPAGVIAILARGTARADRRRAALGFAAGYLAPVLPWVAFSLARGQHFQFQFHHNIAYDVFARSKGIAWDDYQKLLQPQFKSLGDVIARDPGAVARRELYNVWDHLRLDGRKLLGSPVALCALLGVAFAWADGTLRRLWPVALAAGIFFLTLVPVFYSERYSIPLLPLYALLAAAPFASARLTLGNPWLKLALAGVPLVLAGQATVRQTRHDLTQLPVEVLDCSRTLRALARPGDKIICRKPHIAFHGGVEPVAFPFANDLAELARTARAQHARWLYFSWPEAEERPAFWYLLDTAAVVPGLTIRRATAPRPAVLYEIGPSFGTDPMWLANDTLRTWHVARAKLRVDAGDPHTRTRGSICSAPSCGRRATMARGCCWARPTCSSTTRRAPSARISRRLASAPTAPMLESVWGG
ncbi:MAG: glycosyltransferase family 39 protein [Candidatus Eisenbacteria bacterium]|uniref:Glycosyltransferase family 39 protein n=1 Tax=Eiseniibacteriota bacterium TaxID=2212470 RepID=A0A538U2F0_UNCEI|nr:MAG: glycosyltransferase family 39 protein [Candidatus Eisenbacteria bacterium]